MLSFKELMEESSAKELSKKFQIDIEQIVREEYEMIFLKKLFETIKNPQKQAKQKWRSEKN